MKWLTGALISVTSLTIVACSAETGSGSVSDSTSSEQNVVGGCRSPEQVKQLTEVTEQAERCSASPTDPPYEKRRWNNWVSNLVVRSGPFSHRGRDAFFVANQPQWVLGKFAYGTVDKDLKGEDVDVFVQVGCGGDWKKLGTAVTTGERDETAKVVIGGQTKDVSIVADASKAADDDDHWVEGVANTGGRVYFPISEPLPVGHHRIRMVVAGDGTFADQFIEVLPENTRMFVSDVDGTLTERKPGDPAVVCDEESDFPAFLGQRQPAVHEHVAPTFQRLVELGYRPFYLTARPEWLTPHTREFLRAGAREDGRGDLPRGIVHTTLTKLGRFNEAAEAFKKGELRRLAAKGLHPTFGFGNRLSDVATYEEHKVQYRYFFENDPTTLRDCSAIASLPVAPQGQLRDGSWKIGSYETVLDLLPMPSQVQGPACRQ